MCCVWCVVSVCFSYCQLVVFLCSVFIYGEKLRLLRSISPGYRDSGVGLCCPPDGCDKHGCAQWVCMLCWVSMHTALLMAVLSEYAYCSPDGCDKHGCAQWVCILLSWWLCPVSMHTALLMAVISMAVLSEYACCAEWVCMLALRQIAWWRVHFQPQTARGFWLKVYRMRERGPHL